jgi:hypothetical protein
VEVRPTGFARYESFLLTKSFEPYVSMEEIIRNHPERLQGAEGLMRKERLIKAVALLARKMHDQGFNHRDFNATHVLASPENGNGGFDLALFDLQRMDRKKWLRTKWFIKTMAHLSYTSPNRFQRSGLVAPVSDLQRLLKPATDGSASAVLDQDENTEDQTSYGEDHEAPQTERKGMIKRVSAANRGAIFFRSFLPGFCCTQGPLSKSP